MTRCWLGKREDDLSSPPSGEAGGWGAGRGGSIRDPQEALDTSGEMGRGGEGERGEEKGLHGELSCGDAAEFCNKNRATRIHDD